MSLPYSPPKLDQPAGSHLHTEGECSCAGLRSDARAVPKIVGKFLKSCSNQVQVSCPFSPVLGPSHWKTKMGWLCGARWMQKDASLRSRQVKNSAFIGTRPKSVCGFGTMGYRVTVAEFTAQRS
jgi:hypothetical protein